MKKLFILSFMIILFSVLTSAALTVNTNLPDSIPQNYSLEISVTNSTDFISSGVTCTTNLYLLNGTSEFQNVSDSLTQQLQNTGIGIHTLKIVCNTTGEIGGVYQTVSITRTGETTSNIIEGLTWFLFVVSIIGNTIFLVLILVKLVTVKETVFGLLEAWAFYLLLLIVNYMGGFMTSDFIASRTDFLITILTWTNGVLPAISLAVTMMIKGTQKKKPISVNEFTGKTPFR